MDILVVEDNNDIAENIADYFEPLGHDLDFAVDANTALHLTGQQHFDVIVLDIMLPGMNGFRLCQKWRDELKLKTPILMLTAKDQLDDKIAGFNAGADDYLVKPFSVKELELRLKALVKRSCVASVDDGLQVADICFNPETLEITRAGRLMELNPIQRKILHYLMRHSQRAVSRQELEKLVWGDIPPDKDILRSHIYGLRSVIDKPFAQKRVKTVHGFGYRLVADDR